MIALERLGTGTARDVQKKLLEMGIQICYSNVSGQLSKCYFDRDVSRIIVKNHHWTEYQYSIK